MWIDLEQYRKAPLFLTDIQKKIDELGTEQKQPVYLYVCMNLAGEYRYIQFNVPKGRLLEQNRALLQNYILAMMNNMIVSFGGESLTMYYDNSDQVLSSIFKEAVACFNLDAPKNNRTGYGVYVNYINRMNTFLNLGKFKMHVKDLRQWKQPDEAKVFRIYKPEFEKEQVDLLRRCAYEMQNKTFCSLDVGGNSIKGAVVSDGHIVATKEFRWYPTGLRTAEEMNMPQLLMIRFLSDYAGAVKAGHNPLNDKKVLKAMDSNACYECLEEAVAYLESLGVSPYGRFDGIVIGFPDIVVANKIAGGESFKHRGMKNNPNLDYEVEFFKTSDLDDQARVYAKPQHPVIVLNDSNTASFLISVEQACKSGGLIDEYGIFANTVGTEMGTGFISRGGTIQYIPMEGYQHIIDLGNTDYAQLEGDDVRSTKSMNTGIPGTIQKYISQLGLFRMAIAGFCEKDWSRIDQLLERELISYDRENNFMTFVTEPISKRDTLTRAMVEEMLSDDNGVVADAFKMMGKAMGVLIDQDLLIFPEVKPQRLVSGGIVASDAAFSLLRQALKEHNPAYEIFRLDERTACIPLLQQISGDKRSYIVAIGSVFIANRFLLEKEKKL